MHGKILITGSTGMLGKDLLSFFSKKSNTVFTLDRKNGNVLDFKWVENYINSINPDVIIHCLADTNLKRCEQNKEQTLLLHCGLTDCLSSQHAKVVYISSDSAVNPTNFYSKTKRLGEEICILNSKNHAIVRTNIYGFGSSSGGSLFEWAYKNLSKDNKITGYSDVYFNAVYTKQLTRAIDTLLVQDIEGIVNVGGDYQISKYQFLLDVCKVFDFDQDLVSKGTQQSEINRCKNTTLPIDYLKDKLGIKLNLFDGLLELKSDLEAK